MRLNGGAMETQRKGKDQLGAMHARRGLKVCGAKNVPESEAIARRPL
jgi:hypothetical protein